jgi:hypothetical protein
VRAVPHSTHPFLLFFPLFSPLLFLILPVGEGKQTCMFPRDVAVHLLQVGVKVLLSSRFGARWRGDEEKLLSLCLDVAVQKMLLVLQVAVWRGGVLQVLLSKLSSAAECCPSAAECCPSLEEVLPGVEKCCRCCCPSCQVLQNAVQKLQVAAGAAGHMYVLLWRMVQVTCMCC